MAIVKWNPARSFDLFGDFDSLISGFCNRPMRMFRDQETVLAPRIDVIEHEKAYELRAELPGVDKKDIDISVKDDVLTISGEKKHEENKEGENYYCCERRFGSFERSFRMADEMDTNNITAEYKNGVLKVTVPKADVPESKSTKIQIK